MEELYDVVVVGGGCAGLTAALYLARAKCRVLVVEKERFGGQIAITEEVVNYPGIRRISGQALAENIRAQAASFGAQFRLAEVTGLELEADVKTVRTSQGDYRCFGVLLAVGAQPKAVGFAGEQEYRGRGVAYCATCDGEFFTGQEIFVVGGGYAAAEESVFLTKYASHVTILMRKGDFSCASSVADPARHHEKITVLPHTVLEAVAGEDGLDYLRYRNTATGQVTERRAEPGRRFGVFVLAGYAPATGWLPACIRRNEQGYILTDPNGKTSVEGVYAAGDVCVKSLRQVVTATGDGALAATQLEHVAESLRQKTGLHPPAPQPAPEADPAPEIPATGDGRWITPEMEQQLRALLQRMDSPMILRLELDRRPVSRELRQFMEELVKLSEKLTLQIISEGAPSDQAPCVRICHPDGWETGLAFHGVPGGHEFTSFVLGLYNAAGPGQKLEPEQLRRIGALPAMDLKILVTLSCTMCPDLVAAAQRIGAANPHVTAQIYDLQYFPDLRERFGVMSVPCLVINDRQVHFGRKNIPQLLDLLERAT